MKSQAEKPQIKAVTSPKTKSERNLRRLKKIREFTNIFHPFLNFFA